MKAKITVLIITFVVIFSGYLIYEKEQKKEEDYLVTGKNSEVDKASDGVAGVDDSDNKEDSDSTVFAYICGEVSEPGVYQIDSEARIIDVLNAAGGFTENASRDYVNLAQVVSDGMKIYIPSVEETENGLLSGENYSHDVSSSLININTADIALLTSLPGIGETKAEAIVNYRDKNGKFGSVEDILNVSGIGESTFENIKDKITVGE